MKKLMFIFTLIVCLLTGNVFQAFATQDPNVVSMQEYASTLQSAYAQYNVKFEILSYKEGAIITRDKLNKDLENVDMYVKSLAISDVTINDASAYPLVDAFYSAMPSGMFYSKTVYVDWIISSIYGNAGMRSKANVTIDGGNGQIAAVNSYSTSQYGFFINFDKWTTTRMSVTRNSPSAGYIKMVVKGKVTFSYTDPITGIKTGYTSTVSKTLQKNCI